MRGGGASARGAEWGVWRSDPSGCFGGLRSADVDLSDSRQLGREAGPQDE
jgi:hypothetical protein